MSLFGGSKSNKTNQNNKNGIDAQGRQGNVPDWRNAQRYKGHLDAALEYLASTLGVSDDYMVRVFEMMGISGAVVFVDTIADIKAVEGFLQAVHTHKYPKKKPKNIAQYMIERVILNSAPLYMTNFFEIREALAAGGLAVFIDNVIPAIILKAEAVEHRQPQQPTIESSARGSQISFVENLDINLGLIRRQLTTDTLRVKKMKIGYRSHTNVAVIFMDDVVNPLIPKVVLERLADIHIDFISQSSAIEARISDSKWSIFPLTRITQRIDSTTREINQGKVAILTDGDPTALIVPASIQDFFQTEEDYSHSYIEATFVRWLRIIAFGLALYMPALYVALVDFNPELLPKTLGLQIAKSREGVAFPAIIEVVLMQIVIEILREATLRMPKQMGQTIGIVGGLVVGEASVQAGLVSNILIIVIALTAIAVFVTPSYEFATVIRLLAWPMLFCAGIFGLYGIVLLSILIVFHMASLKSFGISYLDPFNGEHIGDVFMDGIVRLPVWMADKRASHLHPHDATGGGDYTNSVPHPQLEKGVPGFLKRLGKRGRRR